MKTGIELIAIERKRQIEKEGFDEYHDYGHSNNELSLAAVCYATPKPLLIRDHDNGTTGITFYDPWPEEWARKWDKRKRNEHLELIPHKRNKKEIIHDLTKAGALIAAEIDRLLSQ